MAYKHEPSDSNKFIRVGSDSLHNWTEAEIYCKNTFRSHLAAIHSLSENNDAFGNGSWYLEYGEMWIGLNDIDHDVEGSYSWIDGTSFDFENWFDTTISEKCVTVTSNNGEWNDVSCSNGYYAFICREIGYYGVNLTMNYSNAEEYCVGTYGTHLGTIRSSTHNEYALIAGNLNKFWIGYNDIENEGNFTWIDGTTNTNYTNWKDDEASDGNDYDGENKDCTNVETNGDWKDTDCAETKMFICNAFPFPFPNTSLSWKYVGVKMAKNWYDANAYCKERYGTSLATIKNLDEHNGVVNATTNAGISSDELIWIGYNFNDISKDHHGRWKWMNETDIRYTYGDDGGNCAYLWNIKNDKWTQSPCSNEYYFVCGGAPAQSDTPIDKQPLYMSRNLMFFSPAVSPSSSPTFWPLTSPSQAPSNTPTSSPTFTPLTSPSRTPSNSPSSSPTMSPLTSPSNTPSNSPSSYPTSQPLTSPSNAPSNSPNSSPTSSPLTRPSNTPTNSPTIVPTDWPLTQPTGAPSNSPTQSPTNSPSQSPTISPSFAPSRSPSAVPTIAPTMSLCDITIQTNNTFLLCNILIQFDSIFNGIISNESPGETLEIVKYLLHSENYCDVSLLSAYVVCDSDDSNEMITHIYCSNCNITGEINDIIIDTFDELMQQGYLQVLDLSNNNIFGSIDKLSPFGGLKNLSVANNNFEGKFDVESLVSAGSINLEVIDLSGNKFDGEIEWSAFEYMTELTHLNLGHNEFEGEIEIMYFENCKNFVYLNVEYNYFEAMNDFEDSNEYMGDIQELYINNNEIDQDFDVSYFSGTRDLKILKCNNNSLRNGNMDMREIPESLKIFDCGFNDFGEFIWDALSHGEYLLEYISLKGAGIYGIITMAFFDKENGGYSELGYVDLSNNEDLNISADFEYLDGQSNIYYLNLLNTAVYGRVDFNYLAQDKNITILMSEDVWCVDSYCGGNTPYGYIRNNYYCYSKDDCEDTCTCDTAYALGLEQLIESQALMTSFWVLIGALGFLTVTGIAATVITQQNIEVPMGRISDTFDIMGYFGFVFRIWDFFSDVLLFENIFSHYQQASVDNPDRDIFERYLVLSATFIAVPFVTNLTFLAYWKHQLSKTGGAAGSGNAINSRSSIDSSSVHYLESNQVAQKWLQNRTYVLVVLCVFSGDLAAGLRMINSNLFGMKYFNMGLSKSKQEDAARHRLWLTILLRNVPQIIIACGYAMDTVGFDNIVLGALISSCLSVVFALFAAFLSFPKHFYFHKLLITLKVSHNGNVETKLGMKLAFKKIICKGLKISNDSFLIENVRYVSNGSKKHIVLDFVSSKPVFDFDSEQNLIGALTKASENNNNNNDNSDATMSKYQKLFNSQARSKKRDILKLLNKCEILDIAGDARSIRFEFDRYECIELKNCSQQSGTKSQLLHDIHVEMCSNVSRVDDHDVTKYDVSTWMNWNNEMLNQWIDYKLKECVCNKEIKVTTQQLQIGDGDHDHAHDDQDTCKLSETSEEEIETFMQSFYELELSGIHLYTMRQHDSNLDSLKCDMELPKNLKKYWIDFKNIILNSLDMKDVNVGDNQSNNITNDDNVVIVYDVDTH